jgi:alcohol dehydrogenase
VRIVTLLQPKRVVVGENCVLQCAAEAEGLGLKRVFLVTNAGLENLVEPLRAGLASHGIDVLVYSKIAAEPSVAVFEDALGAGKAWGLDGVIGIGGGSAMDVAKLVAALHRCGQSLRDVFGINLLKCRPSWLACIPTTSGTGSEVSPNAILFDEESQVKKGVISPCLLPDSAYIDSLLTLSVPPAVTAATGIDALSHCIESYGNKFHHPAVDLYALTGIRLISQSLLRAVRNGHDRAARADLSFGSYYGGLCTGPVNTAAAHALAYPLGGEFHVAHGVSIAVLLPHVLRFNLPAAPERYAKISLALGVRPGGTPEKTAKRGLDYLTKLCLDCGIPMRLSELGIPREAIPAMAKAAVGITRLMKNNLREMTVDDAVGIYEAAY